jgi:hypothetical protein
MKQKKSLVLSHAKEDFHLGRQRFFRRTGNGNLRRYEVQLNLSKFPTANRPLLRKWQVAFMLLVWSRPGFLRLLEMFPNLAEFGELSPTFNT